MSRVKNLRDSHPISWMFKNLCYGGSLDVVSRDRRYIRTASQNYSATCRLLHFIANLIFPFRAQHTGTKGDLQDDRRLVPSYQVVSMPFLKLKIPET
ncbi:hypothetical protein H5410_027755 [Solanum commersonii]|uniref:Uncharacterized protein n=1 Tax=Solanum commersonii TaxID=4109 RepID=A0A9J5Z2Z5_SOLCO|nr:hypothetical protein H5410_027755 [Solanum commersonii]